MLFCVICVRVPIVDFSSYHSRPAAAAVSFTFSLITARIVVSVALQLASMNGNVNEWMEWKSWEYRKNAAISLGDCPFSVVFFLVKQEHFYRLRIDRIINTQTHVRLDAFVFVCVWWMKFGEGRGVAITHHNSYHDRRMMRARAQHMWWWAHQRIELDDISHNIRARYVLQRFINARANGIFLCRSFHMCVEKKNTTFNMLLW